MGITDYASNRGCRARIMAGDVPNWIAVKPRAKYIKQLILSMPPWVTNAELRAVKARKVAMELASGQLMSVGHIVPLNHPLVCGLTVPWNLRIEPLLGNSARGNTWCDDQRDMFELAVGQAEMFE